jgi:hypothetical protein
MKSIKKKTVSKKKFNFVWIIIAILALVAVAFFGINAITGKFILTETDYNSSGYAKPIDVFNQNATIFTISPDSNISSLSMTFQAQVNQSGAYIYRRGYYWSSVNNTWVNFTFPQATIGNSNWIDSYAKTNITVANISKYFSSGYNLFIAYSCKKVSGVWKCGCNSVNDSVCNKWMLQIVNITGYIEPPCNTDSECSSGFACVAGRCAERVVGIGTPEDPFMIYNCSELQNISRNLTASYALASNIDCSDTLNWNDGAGFSPIGITDEVFELTGWVGGQGYHYIEKNSPKFVGTLDGNGHKIIGLNINMPSTDLVGLFSHVGSTGVVRDIELVNSAITGRSAVGTIAGFNSGQISGSSVTSVGNLVSAVGSSDCIAGGAVGFNDGTIQTTSFSGSVVSVSSTCIYGGLVGFHKNGQIINSYSTGTVQAEGWAIGGLVGMGNDVTAEIRNSYSTSNVIGSTSSDSEMISGLVGWTYRTSIYNSFAAGNVSGRKRAGIATSWGGSTLQNNYFYQYPGNSMICISNSINELGVSGCKIENDTGYFNRRNESPMNTWDFANTWQVDINVNRGYPYIQGMVPASIVDESVVLDTSPLSTVRIYNCTDLQNIKNVPSSNFILQNNIDCSMTSNWNSGAGFEPIVGFSGNFEGAGYVISGIYINRPSQNNVGLFSDLSGNISNVKVVNANVTGGERFTGILVGYNTGTISSSFVTGTVSGWYNAGGFVGYSGGIIRDSYSTANVNVVDESGGFVGLAYGIITNCHATGTISGDGHIGGFVGYSGGTISNCYATGAVSGRFSVGGFVGAQGTETISNSYATGTVNGGSYTGGFVGLQSNGYTVLAKVSNSYSTGRVNGNGGGFTGYSEGQIVENSYYDSITSGKSDSGLGEPKSTSDMKTDSTFTSVGWDFENIWKTDSNTNGGYPTLR